MLNFEESNIRTKEIEKILSPIYIKIFSPQIILFGF